MYLIHPRRVITFQDAIQATQAAGLNAAAPGGAGAGDGYGPDGAGYGPDGSGYGPDGSGYGPDGAGYGPDGAGYGPGSGYGPGQGRLGDGIPGLEELADDPEALAAALQDILAKVGCHADILTHTYL